MPGSKRYDHDLPLIVRTRTFTTVLLKVKLLDA